MALPNIFFAARHRIFKELMFFRKRSVMKIADPWLQPNFYDT